MTNRQLLITRSIQCFLRKHLVTTLCFLSILSPAFPFLYAAVKDSKNVHVNNVSQSTRNVFAVPFTFIRRNKIEEKVVSIQLKSTLSGLSTSEYDQVHKIGIDSDSIGDSTTNTFWSTSRSVEEITLYVQQMLSSVGSNQVIFNLNDIHVLSTEPPLLVIDNFISSDDCNAIVNHASSMEMVRSAMGTDQSICSNRTSETVWIHDDDSVNGATAHALRLMTTRAARLSGLLPSHMENLQVVRYTKGQKFDVHTDHFEALNDLDCKGRLASCLIYLNEAVETLLDYDTKAISNDASQSGIDTFQGGSTYFPEYNISITPKVGRALFWWNTIQRPGMEGYHPLMYLDVDQRMRHAGMPVEQGVKWVCNRWIHPVDVGFGVKGLEC